MKYGDPRTDEMYKAVTDFLTGISSVGIIDIFPWLRFSQSGQFLYKPH